MLTLIQKGLCLGTISLIGLSLASCDKSPAPGAAAPVVSSTPPVPVKRIKIGVSVPSADHGWTAGIGWWANRTMALYPDVDWVYQTAANPDEQVKQVENMLGQDIDGLVILATESAPLTPIAKKAHERGVYIVNVDRGFLEPVADVFLEGDNKSFGRKSAEFIAKKMGGKGNLVILEGIPCTVNTDRVEAAKEVFKLYPDIKILGDQPANWNRQKGHEIMQNFLTQFPKIDAVWAQDDDIALGVLQATKEAGRENEMWVFPGAGMKDVIKMVMDKDPRVPADMTYPPSMIGAGIHIAVSSLRDGKKTNIAEFLPKHLMLDVELVTPENAKEFYYPESVY